MNLQAALDTLARDSLPPVAIGLGLLYVVLAVSHAFVLPPAAVVPMVSVASGTAVALLSLRYALGRWAVPVRWAHPIGAGIAGLALLNSLLHLYLTSDPQQTTNLMLLVIGAGFFFLSRRWLALVIAATLAGWGLVAWTGVPSPAWQHFGFGLFTATALSLLIHTVRVRGITQHKRAEEALQKSEHKFRTLLESASEGILIVDRDGHIVLVNAKTEEIFGYDRDELIGQTIETLIPERFWDRHRGHRADYLSHPRIRRMGLGLDLTARRKDGTEFPVEIGLSVAKTEDGTLVISFVTDITERKRAEMLEHDGNRVLEMIAQNRPLADILTQLVSMVERQRPGVVCSVWLLRDGRIHQGAAPGLPDSLIQAVDDHEIGPDTGFCGVAAYRGEIVIVNDIASDPLCDGYREAALSHNLHACWSVPTFASTGEVLGILATYDRKPGEPTEEELQLTVIASRLAAIAIEQRWLADQLVYQARHDPLTGLPNRLLFEERLQQAIAHARRQGKMAALLYLDLDRFKLINDTLGHPVGDALLQQVAGRLQRCARQNDTVARMGGDEFSLILCDLNSRQDAALVAQRLLEAIGELFRVEEYELFVTPSIGISLYPADGDTPEELLRKADNALYRSKERGKNTYRFYDTRMEEAALERLELENQLHEVLERDELHLYYQPQCELASGKWVGVEALLRWNHPELGLIPPARFIPIAEETGLIVPIGEWVLREACRQNRAWQQAGYGPFKVAVNVSAVQFWQADFVETVIRACEDGGLAPRWLQLELTESLLVRDTRESALKMDQLRTQEVSIAIDDFGTHYASLNYLQQLPIDTLKIDQSFVHDIGATSQDTPHCAAMIEAITTLAHSMGMQVMAEGVETRQQLEFLRRINCDGAQGRLFGMPMPASEVEALFKEAKPLSSDWPARTSHRQS